jgi:hypothetical protein
MKTVLGSEKPPEWVVFQKSQMQVNVTTVFWGRAGRKTGPSEHSYTVVREVWESRGIGFGWVVSLIRIVKGGVMAKEQKVRRRLELTLMLVWVVAMSACQLQSASAGDEQASAQGEPAAQQSGAGVVIENESQLADAYPHRHYELQFHAHGGVSVLHWKVEKGTLPPGMKLEERGLLIGEPERPGEFQFTVSVMDGGDRESAVQKQFVLKVVAALAINWKSPARVSGSRIAGTVEVSNTSPDDMDLTFVVMAVADNGRATAIGYQHFKLKRGTIGMELPFGETLPHGGYVIHVDAVGEVPPNRIYRDRMQTAGPLQVTVGP